MRHSETEEETLRVLMAGATNKGRTRKTNQDSIFYDQQMGVGIVADGIGGRKGGEVASSMAVAHVRNAIKNSRLIRHEEVRPFMINAVDNANLAIIARGEHDPTFAGMGTTLESLLFLNDRLYLAHVGDSRTYLYFNAKLWQITLDHNVQNFLERGWLKSGSLPQDWKGQALVRALGLSVHCEIDVYHKVIKPGEIYLTASDGLFDMVSDHEICHLVKSYFNDLKKIPEILINEANRKGGRDNITVLICKVVED